MRPSALGAETPTVPAKARATNRRVAAFDGIRGIGITVVLLFHWAPTSVPGGFAGLTAFFVLSGYLVTNVILSNAAIHDGFAVTPFAAARARRLLPPALVVLATVSVLRVTTDLLEWTRRFDPLATVLQVNNWVSIYPSRESAELLGHVSAVRHTWSLAVEEQFYVLVALAAIVLSRDVQRLRRSLFAIAVVGIVIGFALPTWFGMSHERAFFGTDTRAPEILIGVCLATIVDAPTLRRQLIESRRLVNAVGVAGLGTLTYWCLSNPPGDVARQPVLLPLLAFASLAVVVGAAAPTGAAQRVLSTGPLVWLGLRSYGIYLFHQPTGFLVERWRGDHGQLAHVIVSGSLTIALAALSYRWLEMPVRHRTVPNAIVLAVGASLVAVVVVCALIR